MIFFQMWLQMTVPGYAQEVTRDQLGKRPAGPHADNFRPPPTNSRLEPDPLWYRW